MTTVTYDSGDGTFVVPTGVTSVLCKLWGGGGGGGQGGDGGGNQGGTGGGGGAYCQVAISVTEDDEIAYSVGGGGLGLVDEEFGCGIGSSGGDTTITFDAETYSADGGSGGYSCGSTSVGAGGLSSDGDYHENGGDGSAYDSSNYGGAGGGAGGDGGAGGGNTEGHTDGLPGESPGGGGGGGGKECSGGNGAPGRVQFVYTVETGPTTPGLMFQSF